MKNVLLISEDFIKSTTNLSDNVSGKYLLPAISLAQDVEVEETIGSPLLNKLKELIYNNQIALEENINYKSLLDNYLSPFLAYATIAHLTVPIAFKLTNAGVLRTDDEKMYNVGTNEVDKIKYHYQHLADTYKYRLQRFLIAHYHHFKELQQYKSIADLRANLYSSARCNVWLGGKRGKTEPFNNNFYLGYDKP